MTIAFRNTPYRYGAVAKAFHWTIALLILGLLGVGIYMDEFASLTERFKLMPWHKSFGITVLLLAFLRLVWLAWSRRPAFIDTIPRWQRAAAAGVHYYLYFAMFAMPLSGWTFSSAAGRTVSFFGLFDLPNLVAKNEGLRDILSNVHWYIGYSLIPVIAMHVGAALKHHFIDRDDTLRRMLPFAQPKNAEKLK
jgi:cytochrome b561